MFFIDNAANVCENSNVLKVIYFANQLLKILFIIIPILLIVILAIDFLKSIIAQNDNDIKKNFLLSLKKLTSIIFMFFVPTIVNFFVILMGKFSGPYASCGINASNLDTIAGYEMSESFPIEESDRYSTPSVSIGGSSSGLIPSTSTSNSITGKGKGKATNITIKYNKKDSKGRCGKSNRDYCAAIATVQYQKETVQYFVGYQNNSGIINGSCRSHALMGAINAIKGTTYSTLDLQKYLQSVQGNGVLKAKGIPKALKKYGITAKVYHSETSVKDSATLIKKALDNGQPVMIFVAHSKCSDLAGTHHALLLLGYDDDGIVQFVDSVPYAKRAKKRNITQMASCLSGPKIADAYYRMIIFSFDSWEKNYFIFVIL